MKDDKSYLLKKYAKTSLHVHKDTTTRKVSSVPEVIKTTLPSEELWTEKEKTKPNLSVLRKHLSGEGRLETEDAIRIMELTEKMLDKEPNLLRLDAPLTICGDIHGQFYDLLKLFDISGTPDKVNFLFLVSCSHYHHTGPIYTIFSPSKELFQLILFKITSILRNSQNIKPPFSSLKSSLNCPHQIIVYKTSSKKKGSMYK